MKRSSAIAVFLLLGLLSTAAGAAAKALETVERAITALGGDSALRQVRTLQMTASAEHWEPQSNFVPGGEMKTAGESAIVVTRDIGAKAVRMDWDRKKMSFGPGAFKYSEVYAEGVGFVQGINTTARTLQSRASNPPQHTMSAIKLASFLRETDRANPLLVLDMKANPKALSPLPDQSVGGRKLNAVRYDAGRYAFTVMFDPETGLPARVRSLDTDPIDGDVNYDLVLSDWRVVNGVKFAHAQALELGKRVVAKFQYGSIAVNGTVPADRFAVSYDVSKRRVMPAMGAVPYQWVERRTLWGNFRDTDELVYGEDSPGLSWTELAPGVLQTAGGSHNNLVVEMRDHLIVFDAPIHEQQSRWTIDSLKAKYKKPIKYLVMTHHHWDHANGVRAYVAEGASVVVGKGAAAHYQRVFSAPHTVIADELQRKPRKATIIEVADKKILTDGKRSVGVYSIESQHAAGTLIGMVEDAKLGYVTDIWSPGRDPLPPKANAGMIEVVKGFQRHGLNPERVAGGHGTFGNYRDLAELVKRTAALPGPTIAGRVTP
jgi:glyoxylase-like metal-dependent hydrolase (beta-lactamase superfamily II)